MRNGGVRSFPNVALVEKPVPKFFPGIVRVVSSLQGEESFSRVVGGTIAPTKA
jgi:hypothetical protein